MQNLKEMLKKVNPFLIFTYLIVIGVFILASR